MTGTRKTGAADRETALTDLQAVLDAYGADPTRWPVRDERRTAAWTLLQSGDAEAARRQSHAAALDTALDALAPAPAPSAALTGAILQAAQRPARVTWHDWASRIWKPASALTCAALLGVMVGVLSPVPVTSATGQQLASLETEIATLDGLGQNNGLAEFGE